MTLDDYPEINAWIHARSGAGGAFLSELYDQNWTEEGHWNFGNVRSSKTNEYAGSPNSFIIESIRRHHKFDFFPDWSKETILLGKWQNPITILEQIDCPTFYYVSCDRSVQKYANELVFFKKFVGTPASDLCNSMWLERMKEEAFQKKGWEWMTTMVALQRFRDMMLSISDLLVFDSEIVYPYFLRYNSPYKNGNDRDHFLGYLRGHFYDHRWLKRWSDNMDKGCWMLSDNHSAVAALTRTEILDYKRLFNGQSTDTVFDNYSTELQEYHERNKEYRRRWYDEVLGGTKYMRNPC